MIRFLEHLCSLLVVFLLLLCTAVWTGTLFGKPIDGTVSVQPAQSCPPPTSAILRALQLDPADVRLAPTDSASWQVQQVSTQQPLGILISTAPYASQVEGFAGPTPLYVLLSPTGTIQRIAPADHAETPDFFNRAFSALVPQWQGRSSQEVAQLSVDAVSGATYTSQALIANMQRTFSARQRDIRAQSEQPAIGWAKSIAVIVVILIGIIVAYFGHRRRPLRILVLMLNVGVVGFWCGQSLSITLLRGSLLSSASHPLLFLPAFVLLGVAILLPFFGKKRYYCAWVCPYGSLQDLLGLLPLPRIPCSTTVIKVMRWVRTATFVTLFFLLYAGIGVNLLNYEPFAAFQFTQVAPVVIVLAATFLVANLFVPRLWCRSLCPLGTLLALSEQKPAATRRQPHPVSTHHSSPSNPVHHESLQNR